MHYPGSIYVTSWCWIPVLWHKGCVYFLLLLSQHLALSNLHKYLLNEQILWGEIRARSWRRLDYGMKCPPPPLFPRNSASCQGSFRFRCCPTDSSWVFCFPGCAGEWNVVHGVTARLAHLQLTAHLALWGSLAVWVFFPLPSVATPKGSRGWWLTEQDKALRFDFSSSLFAYARLLCFLRKSSLSSKAIQKEVKSTKLKLITCEKRFLPSCIEITHWMRGQLRTMFSCCNEATCWFLAA